MSASPPPTSAVAVSGRQGLQLLNGSGGTAGTLSRAAGNLWACRRASRGSEIVQMRSSAGSPYRVVQHILESVDDEALAGRLTPNGICEYREENINVVRVEDHVREHLELVVQRLERAVRLRPLTLMQDLPFFTLKSRCDSSVMNVMQARQYVLWRGFGEPLCGRRSRADTTWGPAPPALDLDVLSSWVRRPSKSSPLIGWHLWPASCWWML